MNSRHDLSLAELQRLRARTESSIALLQERRKRLRLELAVLEVDASEAVLRLVLLGVLGPMRLPELVAAAARIAPGVADLRSPATVGRRLAGMNDVRKVGRGLYELADWEESFESWAIPAAATGRAVSTRAGSSH